MNTKELQTKVFNVTVSFSLSEFCIELSAAQCFREHTAEIGSGSEGIPSGGITVAGLRREIAKGRLEVELIAGKHFTTLAAIARMRERCRVIAQEKRVPVGVAQTKRPTNYEAEIALTNLLTLVSIEPKSVQTSHRSRAKIRE